MRADPRTRRYVPALFIAALGALAAWCSFAAAQATLPTGFSDELVVGGLSQPVGMAFLPDGRLLVIEQRSARFKLVRMGPPATADTVGTVPGVNSTANERGLLGIAVDPGWPARPYVYTHSTHTGNRIRISRFTASGALSDPAGLLSVSGASRHDLLTDLPDAATNHNGGTVRFGPDGMLYVSLGEDAVPAAAQDTVTLRGVILRLDVSQLPDGPGLATLQQITPADNPFASVGSPRSRLIWAWGLRNPFRFQIDAPTGRLLITDVGQQLWEEVNVAGSAGLNFGWPRFEGLVINDANAPLTGTATPPIHVISQPGTGASSVMSAGIYRGAAGSVNSFPSDYEGDAFVSDYYVGFLRRLEQDGAIWSLAPSVAGQPTSEHWGAGFETVTDYALAADGALWYCRQFEVPFTGPGQIRRIRPSGPLAVRETPGTVTFAKPFPQPSEGRVEFAWTLATTARVSLVIHDVRGRSMRELVPQEEATAGPHRASWDGRDASGRAVPPGVYFAQLVVNGRGFTQRAALVR